MNVQVIERDGQAEYAVLPWAEFQELLRAAGREPLGARQAEAQPQVQPFALGRLRELREARHQSIEQLARSVGISPHYLTMIESGERQPDQAILHALARVFAAPAKG